MTDRRAVAGALVVNLAAGPLFAWDVFTGAVGRVHGLDERGLGLVLSVGLAAFGAAVLTGGVAADRISPRLLVALTAAASVLGLSIAAGTSSGGGIVLGFGGVLGAATGLGYAVSSRVVAAVPSGKGLVFGLAVGAFGAGPIVVAPAAEALLARIGLAPTFVALGAATGAAMLVGAALLPARPPQRHTVAPRGGPLPWPVILGLCAVFGLGSVPALAAFGYAGELVGDAGAATLAVVLLSVGNLAGRVVAGPVADRIGGRATLHLNSALLLGCAALLVTGVVPFVAIVALGVQYGALCTLTAVAAADSVPVDRFGASYGVVVAGWGVAGLATPVGIGALVAAAGWQPAFAVFVAVAVLAWLAVALTPLPAPALRA